MRHDNTHSPQSQPTSQIHLVPDHWRNLLDSPDRLAVALDAVRHATRETRDQWLAIEDDNDDAFASVIGELYAAGLVRFAHIETGPLSVRSYVRLCEEGEDRK